MRFLKLTILFIIYIFIISVIPNLNGKLITVRSELEQKKYDAVKSWTSFTKQLESAKKTFDELTAKARVASPKLAEKIRKIKGKRGAIGDIIEDMEDLDSDDMRGTKAKVELEFEKQIDSAISRYFEGDKDEANREITEINDFKKSMNDDIKEALGVWNDVRPSGDDVEKKLAWLSKKFKAGMDTKYPEQSPATVAEIKKIQAEEAKEFKEVEKKKNIATFLIYLIEKEKLKRKYRKKYDTLMGEGSAKQVEWDEQTGKMWYAWHNSDKGDYNDGMKKLRKLIKSVA